MKRPKLNESEWLRNVIFLLQENDHTAGLTIDNIHYMTDIKESDITLSCLIEHPSLQFCKNVVKFKPFATIRNRQELVAFFEYTYPEAVRRNHLYGLYAFVDADLDDLLLKEELICLDSRLQSLVYAPCLAVPTVFTPEMCKRFLVAAKK